MYKNIVWFVFGYIAHKHIVPITMEVIRKTHARLEEGKN